MRPSLFHATCVVAIEDESGWVVGLADDEFDTNHYIQFQRAHVFDEQDKALGLDTYYVEKDDQSNSCYGGIESIDLRADSIQMNLDEAGAQSLGLDKAVLITFDTDEQTLDRFRKGLTAVFAGTNQFRNCTSK